MIEIFILSHKSWLILAVLKTRILNDHSRFAIPDGPLIPKVAHLGKHHCIHSPGALHALSMSTYLKNYQKRSKSVPFIKLDSAYIPRLVQYDFHPAQVRTLGQ